VVSKARNDVTTTSDEAVDDGDTHSSLLAGTIIVYFASEHCFCVFILMFYCVQ